MTSLREKADQFRRMHKSGEILVLANAWDVISARIFEQEGFPAIGTTSSGISISLGYPDGEKIPRDEMLRVVSRIAGSVSIPVTADVEAGYGNEPTELVETARLVVSSGAVGLNIEDSTKSGSEPLYEARRQAGRIEAIREAANDIGVPLVINARTDVLVLGSGDMDRRLEEAIDRGRQYIEAGADCVFPLGAKDPKTISEVVTRLGSPVNILATDGVPPIVELKRLGVRRVSVGGGPARATFGLIRRIARELRASGTYGSLLEGALTSKEVSRLVPQS